MVCASCAAGRCQLAEPALAARARELNERDALTMYDQRARDEADGPKKKKKKKKKC
jgi:hypothetical protein